MGAGLAIAVSLALPAAAAAAASPGAATMATTTTLNSSVTSSSYDSWVTFTARVTAATGTPRGSVTFTDTSNGSILDSVALSKGTATFATAALAPDQGHRGPLRRQRHLRRQFLRRTAPPGSARRVRRGGLPDQHRPQRPSGHRQAERGVARQEVEGDPGRDWWLSRGAGDVSYPVIAGGRVFVTVEHTNTYGTTLYALNARTGTTDWLWGWLVPTASPPWPTTEGAPSRLTTTES